MIRRIGQLTIDKVDFRLLFVFFVDLSSVESLGHSLISLEPSSFFSVSLVRECDRVVGAIGGGVCTGVTLVEGPRGVPLAPVALGRWD